LTNLFEISKYFDQVLHSFKDLNFLFYINLSISSTQMEWPLKKHGFFLIFKNICNPTLNGALIL
jgi:hypothetical protein